jgi:hypothetical protein
MRLSETLDKQTAALHRVATQEPLAALAKTAVALGQSGIFTAYGSGWRSLLPLVGVRCGFTGVKNPAALARFEEEAEPMVQKNLRTVCDIQFKEKGAFSFRYSGGALIGPHVDQTLFIVRNSAPMPLPGGGDAGWLAMVFGSNGEVMKSMSNYTECWFEVALLAVMAIPCSGKAANLTVNSDALHDLMMAATGRYGLIMLHDERAWDGHPQEGPAPNDCIPQDLAKCSTGTH